MAERELGEPLARELGAAVRLSASVERIAWTYAGVRLAAAAAELEADGCMVAVRARVLRAIRFEPPLPAELARAGGDSHGPGGQAVHAAAQSRAT